MSLLCLAVPSPYVLLAFQSFVLALGAWPLYVLALRKFDSPAIGLTIAFCALAYPPLGFLNRLDFHAEVIVVPLLIAAYERIDAHDLRKAGIFLGLALLGKENIGLSVAALALVIAVYHNHWRFGFLWCIGGVAYSLVALFLIIPAFRGAPSDTLARYQWLGSTPIEMLWTLLSSPLFVLQNLGVGGTGPNFVAVTRTSSFSTFVKCSYFVRCRANSDLQLLVCPAVSEWYLQPVYGPSYTVHSGGGGVGSAQPKKIYLERPRFCAHRP